MCFFQKRPSFIQLESVNFDSLRVGTGTLFRTNSAEEARNGFCYSAENSAHCEAFRGPRKLREKTSFTKQPKYFNKMIFPYFKSRLFWQYFRSYIVFCRACVRVFGGSLSQKMPKWKRKGTLHPRSNVRGHIVVLAFGRGQRVDAA
jgi:hypothetical protein